MLGYCALEVHTHLMYQVQNNSAVRLNPKPPRPRTVQLPGPEIHRERARSETVVKIPTNFHNIVANIGARGEGVRMGIISGGGAGGTRPILCLHIENICARRSSLARHVSMLH